MAGAGCTSCEPGDGACTACAGGASGGYILDGRCFPLAADGAACAADSQCVHNMCRTRCCGAGAGEPPYVGACDLTGAAASCTAVGHMSGSTCVLNSPMSEGIVIAISVGGVFVLLACAARCVWRYRHQEATDAEARARGHVLRSVPPAPGMATARDVRCAMFLCRNSTLTTRAHPHLLSRRA